MYPKYKSSRPTVIHINDRTRGDSRQHRSEGSVLLASAPANLVDDRSHGRIELLKGIKLILWKLFASVGKKVSLVPLSPACSLLDRFLDSARLFRVPEKGGNNDADSVPLKLSGFHDQDLGAFHLVVKKSGYAPKFKGSLLQKEDESQVALSQVFLEQFEIGIRGADCC